MFLFITLIISAEVDFSTIKQVLKNDQLVESAKLKEEQLKKDEAQKKVKEASRYNIPKEDVLWGFITEYFLVKNRELLGWDKEFADYGFGESFSAFLKEYDINAKFKILLVENDKITHFGFPGYSKNEYVFLLSIHFIRELSISKKEIHLILLEDLMRLDLNLFQKKAMTNDVQKLIGKNVYPQKMNINPIRRMVAGFDKLVWEKGFTFQEQYDVTKKLIELFKRYPALKDDYISLLEKLNRLIPISKVLNDYNKIYPSPEFQLTWLKEH